VDATRQTILANLDDQVSSETYAPGD